MTEPITGLIHHPYRPPAFAAVPVPVYKASTVFFPNVAAMRNRDYYGKSGYSYGLHGTPTTYILEERLCHIDGATHCQLAPSGLAAVAIVDMAMLSAGDHVLLPENVYGPSRVLAENELKRWGITYALYDPMRPQTLADAITPHTKLIWLEAPGSITQEFPDLTGLIAVARKAGVVTALDNTWGAGMAFAPFAQGIDICITALTKYASGGADVLMGSITTRDDALHQRIKATAMHVGNGVAANDAELVLRALPSIALRYHAQDASARALAAWLGAREEIAVLLHPALPGGPGHAHWQQICKGAACIFSVVFQAHYTQAQVDAFVDALQLFEIGFSWAGPQSLCVPYPRPERPAGWPHAGCLVRFSVGLEAVSDLIADAEQALSTMKKIP
jgi:cysteine-S-conjugate beta-lyase